MIRPDRLREVREEIGLRADRVAGLAGITPAALNNYELGRRAWPEEVAEFLGRYLEAMLAAHRKAAPSGRG